MAYDVVDPIALTPVSSAAGSYALTLSTLGLTLVDNDWLILEVLCTATSGTLSISGTGWSEEVELDVSSGQRMGLYKCIVASGTAADPTVSLSSGTGLWQVTFRQVRDADAINCIDGSSNKDGGSVSSTSTTAYTPSTNDCLVVYFGTMRSTSSISARFDAASVVAMVAATNDDGSVYSCTVSGQVQQGTAAATTLTMYSSIAGRMGIIVYGLKNKTGGKLSRDCRAGLTKVAWMGDYGTQHESLSTTWNAPSTFCTWGGSPETINGINADTAAATISNTFAGAPPFYGKWTNVNSTLNGTAWVGGWFPLIGTIDFTGKLFSLEWFFDNLGNVGNEGVIIAFGDNASADTGNAAVFKLADRSNITVNTGLTSFFSPENTTPYVSVGTINWATVNKIGIFYHRLSGVTLNRAVSLRNLFLHSNSIMTGGCASHPLDIRYLDKVLNGWGYAKLCEKQGDAIMVKTPIQFGDGTKETYIDTTATLLNTPNAYNVAIQPFYNIGANLVTVGMYASASDSMNFTAAAMASGQKQNFTINASTSASAAYDFTGQTFSNWTPTWATNVPVNGGVFTRCATIAFKGTDVSNATITETSANSSSAACLFDANGVVVTSTTIDVTGTSAGYHIELGTAVTAITLTNVTFTGTPGTDKVHVLATTGTVTITISGTTSLVAGDVTSAGATVVISAPVLYQTVTISSATAGSRIQIYDTTSSTELYNGTPTFPYTWTDSVAASASRAIRLRCTYVSGVTAKQFIEASIGTCGITSGTESVSYIVNQVNDDTYNTNGINGPAIYATSGITFTDAATDLVNCNIAGGAVTYPTIYACFAHWCNTSTGIANDFTYIDAPDTANYLFSSMKIKNTSATALTVTGGWGRDATSGLSADIIDTAGSTGNIFLAPDHVTPFSTGSGLTAGQDSKLTAIDSVCSLFNFNGTSVYADVKKMNGSTVNGTGVAGDLWRG